MKYLFLAVFIIATGIHLYASKVLNQKLRNYTKPFILAALLGYYMYACSAPTAAMILALIFSWLGDVLLMGSGTKFFTAGGIAFMISHAFFVWAYSAQVDFARINPVAVVAVAVIYTAVTLVIFKKLKPYLPKALFYPMLLYLLINGTMNCFAFYRLMTSPGLWTAMTYIGALLFFVSDSSLFFVRFNKEGKQKTHFLVMLTYSLGEFLIVLGML